MMTNSLRKKSIIEGTIRTTLGPCEVHKESKAQGSAACHSIKGSHRSPLIISKNLTQYHGILSSFKTFHMPSN